MKLRSILAMIAIAFSFNVNAESEHSKSADDYVEARYGDRAQEVMHDTEYRGKVQGADIAVGTVTDPNHGVNRLNRAMGGHD